MCAFAVASSVVSCLSLTNIFARILICGHERVLHIMRRCGHTHQKQKKISTYLHFWEIYKTASSQNITFIHIEWYDSRANCGYANALVYLPHYMQVHLTKSTKYKIAHFIITISGCLFLSFLFSVAHSFCHFYRLSTQLSKWIQLSVLQPYNVLHCMLKEISARHESHW